MQTIDGQMMRCLGTGRVQLRVQDVGEVSVDVVVVDRSPLGFKFILGMNGITALGGVSIDDARRVRFNSALRSLCGSAEVQTSHHPAAEIGRGDVFVTSTAESVRAELAETCSETEGQLRVEGEDFQAVYDSERNRWLAEWKWSEETGPRAMHNKKGSYSVPSEYRDRYETELKRWIQEGWLVPYDASELGEPKGLIPLMAVVQEKKQKVRPVMDYRELNEHIEAYTADADVCAEKLRTWRKMGVDVAALDLKSAYLQIHVKKALWSYQTVVFEGKRWALTRLGFGLNVAPLLMKAIVNRVLSLNPSVREATSSFVDDILVREDTVTAEYVREHLAKYGLLTKEPERVRDGARLLGLSVWREGDRLRWRRGSEVERMPEHLSRRTVFSTCGKLLGHYPVCGWLRVATAFIKRRANNVTQNWDEPVSCEHVRSFLEEVQTRVARCDPARGRWDVSGETAHVWVDASSIAIGVVLEVNGEAVEDASWLRSSEVTHINMAELDAVVKGLNMALTWGFTELTLHTDSATVHRWMSDALTGKSRLRTKAASEMLIRRRIGIVASLVQEYSLKLSVVLVPSAENRADELTRVPQRWLRALAEGGSMDASPYKCGLAATEAELDAVIARVHHESGHPGVRRTVYFVKRVHPGVTKRQVRSIVSRCETCRSIDPAPVKWRPGKLEVSTTWSRVGMDITHYKGRSYLSLVDCGPSRFTLWRPLRAETSAAVTDQLESVFMERGAPQELLLDNDTAFRSHEFGDFARRWRVALRFRCAYVASGNGITERCHRSVKVIAARSRCTIAEAVYLYNVTPRDDKSSDTAPANMLYRYEVVRRNERNSATEDTRQQSGPSKHTETNRYKIGDHVWVKPSNVRCDTRFDRGIVTGVVSEQAVEVGGIPRHVRDLRPRDTGDLKLGDDIGDAFAGDDETLWTPPGDVQASVGRYNLRSTRA